MKIALVLILSFLSTVIISPNVSSGATAAWSQINTPVPSGAQITSLAIDPYNQDIMYIGTTATTVGAVSGIYKSVDAGSNWALTNIQQDINSIVVNGNTIIAAPKASTPAVSLFRSNDGGVTWTSINMISTTFGSVLEIKKLLVDAGITFAFTNHLIASSSVYKSLDLGATWSPIFSGTAFAKALAVDPSNPSNILLSTSSNGVFRSTDGGATFIASNTGLPTSDFLNSIVHEPSNTNIVYGDGYISTNGGLSWASNNYPLSGAIRQLRFDASGARYVLSGVYSYTAVDSTTGMSIATGLAGVDSIYKSTDGGATFIPSVNGEQLELASASVGTINDFYIANGFMYIVSDQGMFKQSTIYSDMQIEEQSGTSNIDLGEVVDYSIKVINNGPDNATSVVVSSVLSSSVLVVSAASSQGSCSVVNSTLTCNLGSLVANNNATISLSIKPTSLGSMTNIFTVTANEPDPFDVSGNNSTSLSTVIFSPIDPAPSTTVTTTSGSSGGCLTIGSSYILFFLLMGFLVKRKES